MAEIRAIVIAGNGTNCEMETAHACRLGGFDRADIVHISSLIAGETKLDDYRLLALAGGFLDGDDLGSAKAAANLYSYASVEGTGERFADAIRRFIEGGRLILGICNGFQLLAKLGLVPAVGGAYFSAQATLTNNARGRFEDRWVTLGADPASPCVFTRGIDRLEVPVRHGEGRFVFAGDDMRRRVEDGHQVVFRYLDPATGTPTEDYPANPNGSPGGVAAVCDPTGRVMGMMPHPEAFLHKTNHPRWTRLDLPEEGAGVALFRNAAAYLKG
jgi:phosphoribosylformylglycinamidine synthase subunit PurQ / glutaminase